MKKAPTFGTRPALLVLMLAAAGLVAAVEPGQVDDFQDGTVMGWSEGFISPNPPFNEPNGGPMGSGDAYLENTSTGGTGAGSRMVMFNNAQWTGDFNNLGFPPTIRADMANFGGELLFMRVAIEGANGARYASTDWTLLDPDGMWNGLVFEMSDATMTLVEGSGSLASTLDTVIELRILSSFSPSWQGDQVLAVLGVDNIAFQPYVFSDGFDSGNVLGWSASIP